MAVYFCIKSITACNLALSSSPWMLKALQPFWQRPTRSAPLDRREIVHQLSHAFLSLCVNLEISRNSAWSVGALERQLQFRGGLQIALCTCAECAPDLRKTCAFFYAWIWELCVGFCWWVLLLASLPSILQLLFCIIRYLAYIYISPDLRDR